MSRKKLLPLPPHYNSKKVDKVWRVPYQERAKEARQWAQMNEIPPAEKDRFRICLILVDVQNTFCLPDFELFVGGRSGKGAVEDNRRLCEFMYHNLDVITEICPTMDTHQVMQIFHSIFLVNETGAHPDPFTSISEKDIEKGVWKFTSELAASLGIAHSEAQEHLLYYTKKLQESGKYDLTVWPYHAMLGGIGHALVASVDEAIFFHSVARFSQPDFQIKGKNPLTENYSVLRPEVLTDKYGNDIGQTNKVFLNKLLEFDAIIIAGQAKSHCVAWTVADLLDEIQATDPQAVGKVYLLEDCMSPVVIPGGVDYTEQADTAFEKFADAGMNIVESTEPMNDWPGIKI